MDKDAEGKGIVMKTLGAILKLIDFLIPGPRLLGYGILVLCFGILVWMNVKGWKR